MKKTVIPATVHITGPYKDWMQYCIRCNCVIVDYRNASWPNNQEPPKGWEEGMEVVISNGNPSFSGPRSMWNGPMNICNTAPDTGNGEHP